jgi:hypothetical protein
VAFDFSSLLAGAAEIIASHREMTGAPIMK